MNPRVNYEMTEKNLEELLEACKPTPVMFLSGGTPIGSSPQGNANRAWAELGKKMGFDSETVRPDKVRGNRFFTAVPSETEAQRQEREQQETKEKKETEIKKLQEEIKERQEKLKNVCNRNHQSPFA